MRIYFKKLIIDGFMSFGHCEVALEKLGFVSIEGRNELDEGSRSNGSGKSALLEAIIWNLTGNTLRGSKDVVNQFLKQGTKVQLEFLCDDHYYKIIRYKDDKQFGSDLKIFDNECDKSGKGIRESQKILNDILPDLNSDLIASIIILGQGLPNKFTDNTPSGRKEILEKLCKSDFMIEDLKCKLNNRKAALTDELQHLNGDILSCESKKQVLEASLAKYNNDLAALDGDDFDNKLSYYDNEIARLQAEIVDAKNEKQRYSDELSINSAALSKAAADMTTQYAAAADELNIKYDVMKLEDMIQSNRVIARALQDQINQLDSVVDICPTCGQKLPDVHKIDTSDLKLKLDNTLNIIATQQEELNNIKSQINSQLSNIQSSLHQNLIEIENKDKNLRSIFNESDYKCSALISELNKLEANKAITLHGKHRIASLKQERDECDLNVRQLCEKILYYNNEKEEMQLRLSIITRMISNASREFRGILLSEVIQYIQTKAKEYCAIIFGTDNISFMLDGNNISIAYCDKAYESLSGGEKQRLDIIIQLALRDMLTQYLDFSSNIIALDEIFDNLDDVGCNRILDLITNKLSDVDSVFIISHHSNTLSIPYDTKLNVIKRNNGVSELL